MNVQTGKKQQEGRNPRAELRALMRRDLLLPAAIGYDIAVSPDAIVDWLKGERKSADFVASIIEFIDAYNHTWGMLAVASNAVRAEMGLKFISNIGVLINEIETAPAARRGELRDVLMEEVTAAQHVIQLMGAEGGQSPERLAETIRAALGPGDAMLIRRGGDKAR